MEAPRQAVPGGGNRMSYQQRGGLYQRGVDQVGRQVWQIKGVVDKTPFSGTVHGSKTEARRELTRLRRDALDGRIATERGTTTEAFFERYVMHKIANKEIREGQVATTYRGLIRRHILPRLPIKLSDVKADHVQVIPDT